MKTIVEVKEGVWSSFVTILFLLGLCAFLIWCRMALGKPPVWVLVFACGVWLFGCWILVDAMIHPKSARLSIEGDHLVWIVRALEGGEKEVVRAGVPLSSIRMLEIVLPKMGGERNARNYSIADLFVTDATGNRHQLPTELFPGVYQEKIAEALKEVCPGIEVRERMA
jgi:hypothetical protein